MMKIDRKLILNGLSWLFLVSGCSFQNSPSRGGVTPPLLHQPKSPPVNPINFEPNHQEILNKVYLSLKELNACEGEIDESTAQEMSSIYSMEDGKYVVQFLCFLGAYQGNYQYFLYDTNQSKISLTPLDLTVFEANMSGKLTPTNTQSIGGIPEYNSEAKTLTIYTKYRGLGDCGSLAKYHWEQQRFKLLEYRVKSQCDGTYLEPEQYSLIYPSQ